MRMKFSIHTTGDIIAITPTATNEPSVSIHSHRHVDGAEGHNRSGGGAYARGETLRGETSAHNEGGTGKLSTKEDASGNLNTKGGGSLHKKCGTDLHGVLFSSVAAS